MNYSYEGFYARFEAPNKKVGATLLGPDNLVGDAFSIEARTDKGETRLWLSNKFGADVGFFTEEYSRRVQLALAREQRVFALLSFVAYSDTPDPGLYWGEMAVICFNQAYAEEMDVFRETIKSRLIEGIRPKIDFRDEGIKHIMSDPYWVPSETTPLPEKKNGMAILKKQRSLSERAIEQGRAKNKGCYFISIVFLVGVVFLVVFGLGRCTGLV